MDQTSNSAHLPSKNVSLPYPPSNTCLHGRSGPSSSSGLKGVHRSAKSLYKEALHDVTLDTGTDYPCTQGALNASGGANRATAIRSRHSKDKSKWFARPNKGPFVDPRIAAREIFDHNDLNRSPSAAEEDAIGRLREGFKRAATETWGPDLAIKAFCDLDKVFFGGRLRGHVCLAWKSAKSLNFQPILGVTSYLGKAKCVIHLNADSLFLEPNPRSSFATMFETLLHEMCHAHCFVRAIDGGSTGWMNNKPGGHGRNFGTRMHAVNKRAWELFGLIGDLERYPCHAYVYGHDPSPSSPRQPRPHGSHPRHPSESARPPKSGRELYKEASKDVLLDSGTNYPCQQSDLDATGGLTRKHYPGNRREDQKVSRKEWFPRENHGPFVSARQATLDVFQQNRTGRKNPSAVVIAATDRFHRAIDAACRDGLPWGPDLIIKAFCDLDIIFFGGKLRGHVCVRWLPDWSPPGTIKLGTTCYLGKGKSAINLNADVILRSGKSPYDIFEEMFATVLHEMCHAYLQTQAEEKEIYKIASHGKCFGTQLHAVRKRVKDILGRPFRERGETHFPRHKYENGEGFP